MKKKYIVVWSLMTILLLLLSSTTIARHQTNFEADDVTLEFYQIYSLYFSENDLAFQESNGYDVPRLTDGGICNNIGEPQLPSKTVMIAIPHDIEITSVTVQSCQYQSIPGSFNIAPSQPLQLTDGTPLASQASHDDMYDASSTEAYPLDTVVFSHQTDLAGQNMAVLTVYPLKYTPFEKHLSLLTHLSFSLEGVTGYECGDYLFTGSSVSEQQQMKERIQSMVINPDDVVLQEPLQPPIPMGVPPGDYDYVIVTREDWVDNFQPLADWKTKKGVRATIVDTEWIYDTYSGTSEQDKIRYFVKDAAVNWGTKYVLLGGDTNYIPVYIKYIYIPGMDEEGWYIPTDTYYADYDSDWTCEVNVGRASVYHIYSSAGGITNFLNKQLTYEQNPPLTDYAKKIALFGFDLTSSHSEGEDCKEDIEYLYIPSGMEVTTVYDSDTTWHESKVKSAMNNGQNLVNHIDHCFSDYLGTGNINHGTGLDVSEVDAFYNGEKQSIFYTFGCWPAAFDESNCIGEHFVRDDNGGGIAFIGNTRFGIFYAGDDDSLSMRYDRYFFRSLFDQDYYHLGECFYDHKMDAFLSLGGPSYDANCYVFTTLNLLGDPETPIWTEDPKTITEVNYPQIIETGDQTFTVFVYDDGEPVQGASVCAQKEDEVYVVGTTSVSGKISLEINPSTEGILQVTVTGHNYLLWEGTATVISSSIPADVNGDGVVDVLDLLLVLSAWDQTGSPGWIPEDITIDGVIDVLDLLEVLGHWT